MRERVEDFGPSLRNWADVARGLDRAAILVGNGASLAVWEGFAYDSLFETARSAAIDHPLTDEDQKLFHALGTSNFEQVLEALQVAQRVSSALGRETSWLQMRYSAISRSLVEAIRAVHLPRNRIPQATLQRIRRELTRYARVYSTNYDLIIYWAIMAEGPRPTDFKDFFWSQCDDTTEDWVCFDEWNTSVSDDATLVYYLHGGLHLYELPWAGSAKRVAGEAANLLDIFSVIAGMESGETAPIPLFVVEGDWKDKLQVIQSSEYLQFAYARFRADDLPLVVFGHSLSEQDFHIAEALKRHPGRTIAVSLLPREPDVVVTMKHRFKTLMPRADLSFFDASTHPLGDPSLRVSSLAEEQP